MSNTKFKPADRESERPYENLSCTTLLGEKDPLMEALNSLEHPYTSFSHFARAAINMKLAAMGSKFQLTEK